MILEARIRGLKALEQQLEKVAESARMDAALEQAADEVRAEAIAGLNDGGSPETRTGALEASIESAPGARPGTVAIGTRLDYGWFLEFGTRRMPARPWLRPAFERALNRVREIIAGAV